MKIRIQMIIETDDEPSMPPMEIGRLERDHLSPSTLGLSLAEARQVLLNLQAHMVDQQIQEAT